MSVDLEANLYATITLQVETDPNKDFTGQTIREALLHTFGQGFDTNHISIDSDKFDVENIDDILNSITEMKVDGEVIPKEAHESKIYDRFAYVEKLKYETTVEVTCRLPMCVDFWVNAEDNMTLLECIVYRIDDFFPSCGCEIKIEDIYKITVTDDVEEDLPITPETLALKSLECDNCWDYATTKSVKHYGKTICPECYDKSLFPCYECDGEFKLKDMIKCEDEYYCKDCDAKLKAEEEDSVAK